MLCKGDNLVSYSMPSDGETFISADDLRINLWNLEISSQCFNIVDLKPSNMEDLTGTSVIIYLSIYFFLFWAPWFKFYHLLISYLK